MVWLIVALLTKKTKNPGGEDVGCTFTAFRGGEHEDLGVAG